MLCYWRDRVSDALALLKKLAADEHPRVRLEAVRAASFFDVPEAVEVVADRRFDSRATSTIDFVRGETLRTLDPHLEEGPGRRTARSPSPPTPASATCSTTSPPKRLLKLERTPRMSAGTALRGPALLDERAGRRRAAAGRNASTSRRWPS